VSIWESLLNLFRRSDRRVVLPDIEVRTIDSLRSESVLYDVLEERPGLVSQLFYQAVSQKSEVIDLVDSYRDTFFHSAIVDLLVDDVISVDPGMNDVVDISSENEEINRVIEELQERIDIDSFVQAIIDDVISYGDVVVAVEHDGKKVVELHPVRSQKDVVVVYKGHRPLFLVKFDKLKAEFKVEEYVNFIHFCIPGRKIKVKVEEEFLKALGYEKKVDEYILMGKPLFWGCWDLLNSLYILTVFYPVFSVQKMNATTVLGVRVPREMPPEKAYQVARKYMELLNVNIAVDRMGRVSVADVIDTIGKYKVIPIFADDEKGLLQLNDPRLDESYNLDVLEDLRRTLCATLGIPYQFLFGGAEGTGKLETLKAFNRYVKRVARIQRAIVNGLTQLVLIECELRGYKVSSEMVNVRFRNSIVSVEHLDKLEFLAGMVDTVNNAVGIVADIAQAVGGQVNTDKLIEFVNEYMGLVGLDGVIVKKNNEDVVSPENMEIEMRDVGRLRGEVGGMGREVAGGTGAGEVGEFEEEPFEEEEFPLRLS